MPRCIECSTKYYHEFGPYCTFACEATRSADLYFQWPTENTQDGTPIRSRSYCEVCPGPCVGCENEFDPERWVEIERQENEEIDVTHRMCFSDGDTYKLVVLVSRHTEVYECPECPLRDTCILMQYDKDDPLPFSAESDLRPRV